MKKTLLFFWLIALVAFGHAQTVHPDYVDGKISFKILNGSEDFIPEYPIEGSNTYFDTMITKFGITKVERQVKHSDKPRIRRLYTVHFDSIYKADALVGAIEQFGNVEFAEKLARLHFFSSPNDPKLHLQWA